MNYSFKSLTIYVIPIFDTFSYFAEIWSDQSLSWGPFMGDFNCSKQDDLMNGLFVFCQKGWTDLLSAHAQNNFKRLTYLQYSEINPYSLWMYCHWHSLWVCLKFLAVVLYSSLAWISVGFFSNELRCPRYADLSRGAPTTPRITGGAMDL